jgi:alpha-amylase
MAASEPELHRRWQQLTTSDHLYYMCTKWSADGDVHKHFSPYATPHDAFIAFMNVLDDVERRAGDVAKGRLTATIPLVLGPRGAVVEGSPSPAPPPRPRRGSRSRRPSRPRVARVPRAR